MRQRRLRGPRYLCYASTGISAAAADSASISDAPGTSKRFRWTSKSGNARSYADNISGEEIMKSADARFAGHRNIPHDGQTEQGLDVRIVRLRLQRIPEEDDEVDHAFRNLCADLLVATERTALQLENIHLQRLFEQGTSGSGRAQFVLD